MRKLAQLLFMLLLGVALLAACGEDTASDDNTTETNNNDADDPEKGTEPEEDTDNVGEINGTNEGTEDEEETAEENEDNSSGFAEDQQLTLGETGLSDSTLGTFEITLDAVRTVDEVEGELPLNDMYVIAKVSIKNITDEPIEAEDLAAADIINDTETHGTVYWDYGFEGEIAPGDSFEGELVFDVNESSYYELVYGYALSTVSNEVRWRFEADDIE